MWTHEWFDKSSERIRLPPLPEVLPPSPEESLAEGRTVELLGLIYSIRRKCREISSLRPQILMELFTGAISIQAIEFWAYAFQELGQTASDTVSLLRKEACEYKDFVQKYTVSDKDIKNCLVSVSGSEGGIGFIVDFQGCCYVVTCAHVIGNKEQRKLVIRGLDGRRIACFGVYKDEELDIAILHIPDIRQGIPLDEKARGEIYLQAKTPEIKAFYLITERGDMRMGHRKGSIICEMNDHVKIDMGHVRRGESGAPIFFPLGGSGEKLSLIGVLCAREMERVLGGAQTVGAFMVKLSSLLQVLRSFQSTGRI